MTDRERLKQTFESLKDFDYDNQLAVIGRIESVRVSLIQNLSLLRGKIKTTLVRCMNMIR
jgi:hypothetical protein